MRAYAIAIMLGLMWPAADAVADGACPTYAKPTTSNRGSGVLVLLQDVPIETGWAQLPAEKKRQLQMLADERLADYRSNWSADALAVKETILLRCATTAMTTAMTRYYRAVYPTVVPSTFTLKDIKNAALADALVRSYLGNVAAGRSMLTYPNGTPLEFDWDGQSLFDSIRLPDKQTYEDIKAYNGRLLADLNKIDEATLNDLESRLKQYAMFSARSNAAGSSGDSYGSDYLQQACEIASLNYDILAGYELEHARPRIFPGDDDVLREANAIYLGNTPLEWLDVGTRFSAVTYCGNTLQRIRHDVGDPAASSVAKGMILLQNWWVERLNALTASDCTIYSPQDRSRIWDAFSADQQFNNDHSSSIETFTAKLDRYKLQKIAQYRETVRAALQQVFPDRTILTQEQHDRLLAAIDQRTDFGRFLPTMPQELDRAQGTKDGPAARHWAAAVTTNVEYIGGYADNETLRLSEREQINTMFGEVKDWIARRYQGYPIDVASLLDVVTLEVNTLDNAFTEAGTAKILIGVGTRRSKAEYYSWLLHEFRHAVRFAWLVHAPDKMKVSDDEGPANEGAGVAVEELLLVPFLKETLKSDLAVTLYMLDYAIRDARYVGTTDATLRKYLRASCDSADNTLEFAKNVARSYGLLGRLADTAAQRAHAGTQYLQYVWSGSYMLDEIQYLQTEIDPGGGRRLDPYVLFACELNTPRRDRAYVDKLKACLAKR